MTRFFRACLALCIATALLLPSAAAYSAPRKSYEKSEMDCTRNVKLSAATKKRLDEIYHRIYMDYTDLIETYTWAGALTRQQKETRMAMLKNYINKFKWMNYKWCSEHEPDEWEEEWFNSDRD